MKHPFHAHTRVVIANSIADVTSPTLAELGAATDVTSDLMRNGLQIGRRQRTITREPWSGDIEYQVPTSFTPEINLVGYRFLAPHAELLWNAVATFRSTKYLVVRRAYRFSEVWAAGQVVEVFGCRVGKRETLPSDDGAVIFRVPLLPFADHDDAVVAA